MSVLQQFLVCDSSTLANFKQWAQAISTAFSTFGWAQSADTGQVNWATISTVPGSNTYVYEIWKPNDGLTNFYLKIEYGNNNSTNCPSLRLSIGPTTDGAGTLTGLIVGPQLTDGSSFTPVSATNQWDCRFSGTAGRIAVMLWRDSTGGGQQQQLFAVERSLNSAGSYTSAYVTLWTAGYSTNPGGGGFNSCYSQRSYVFGVGPAPLSASNITQNQGGWCVRIFQSATNTSNTASFNGSIPIDTCAPQIGYFDYPCTVVGCASPADFSEAVTFTATLYGVTRTFLPSKMGTFGWNQNNSNNPNGCAIMRYD